MLLPPMDNSEISPNDIIPVIERKNQTPDSDEEFNDHEYIDTVKYESEELPQVRNINISELKFQKIIGKGSFGVVHKALWTPHSIYVAVKRVETVSELLAHNNEKYQLSRVSHENIIQLYGTVTELSAKCLVLEFADGGSLNDFLHSPPYAKYNLSHVISWLLQCAKAIAYLHAYKPGPIVHRDLKPLNMLLINDKKVLKICDFGTACSLKTIMTNQKGSTAWMAPEVMQGSKYSEKCDVYSWGIILWQLLTRRIPFKELGIQIRIFCAVAMNHGRPPPIQDCPKPLENLMQRCWLKESMRPTMLEVIDVITPIYKIINNGEEFVHDSSLSESFTESCVSPINDVSNGGHTSEDVSEFSSSVNTFYKSGDSCHEPSNQTPIQQEIQLDDFVVVPHPNAIYPNMAVGGECWRNNISFDTPNTSSSNLAFPPSSGLDSTPKTPYRVMPSSSSPVRYPYSHSSDRRLPPLTIDIPHMRYHVRDDVVMVAPHQCHESNYNLTPVAQAPPISSTPPTSTAATLTPKENKVPMRSSLLVNPSEASIRRKSTELPPNCDLYKKTLMGHKRASSYESAELIGFESINQEILNEFSHPASTVSPGDNVNYVCAGVRRDTRYSGLEAPFSNKKEAGSIFMPTRLGGTFCQGASGNSGGTTAASHLSSSQRHQPENAQLEAWQLLEDEFKPLMPLSHDPHSQQIFNDHKMLAHKLLVVQEEIVYLDREKNKLLDKISDQDREQKACKVRYNDTIQQLENQTDDLQHIHSRISHQAEDIRRARHQQQSTNAVASSYIQTAQVPTTNYSNYYDQSNRH